MKIIDTCLYELWYAMPSNLKKKTYTAPCTRDFQKILDIY